ncbi:unnamed protein product, partial [Mesorhabditis belari]|uniref:Uncharacterized protein n=1 Tax=Mesorhabditis belari TaxID=2138241 RepID=A0AAF3EDI5_9BILA
MSIQCHPICNHPLPQFGTVRIKTEFNMCAGPPEFIVNVRHDVPSTSTFKAQVNGVQEVRRIGTEHWPLNLDVDFHRIISPTSDEYFLRACIETVRIGDRECFINETFRAADIQDCSGSRPSSIPLVVSGGLVCIFFVSALILLSVLIHRLYKRVTKQSDDRFSSNKSGSMRKQQANSQLLPSYQSGKLSIEDDRLTVIAEEGEDGEETENKGGFTAIHNTLHNDPSMIDKSWMPLMCSPRRDSSSSGFSEPTDGELVIPPLLPPSIRSLSSNPSSLIVSIQSSNQSRIPFQTFRPLANHV